MSLERQKFEFGDFLLDGKEKILLRSRKPLSITPKAFELLYILVKNHGHLVEKAELLNTVWADSFVGEPNLAFTIGLLRKALQDDAQKPRFIETVPKRGYRFIADVKRHSEMVLPADQSKQKNPVLSSPKPYVLITISTIFIASLFAVAFVWFSGKNTEPGVQTTNRLTNSGKVTVAVVSPDGQTLVFAQKEGSGESLWRREIGTGYQTQILPPEAVEFVGLTVSPDSDYAYYSVFTKNEASLTLMRISLNGGTPEPLSEIASDVSVSFSPDGKKFAYTQSHSAVKQTLLRTAFADGSEPRTLLTLKGDQRSLPVFRANPVAWSPDGREIACAVQEIDGNKAFFKIVTVNLDDGSEKYLSERGWDYIESIVWKDEENLAITNYEPNSPGNQIWLISRKTGEARQLNLNQKEYEWLSAADGNLFAVETETYSSLYITDFGENHTKIQTKQIFNEAGVIKNIDWSKDGKIFYNSWGSGRNEIWQINPDGTNRKQLTNNSNLTLGFTVSPTDGTLVFTTTQNRADSLLIAEADGQNTRQLTYGTFDSGPRFMPDGKEVIFQQGSLVKPTIWRVSTEKNQPSKQITGYFARQPAISPDGKTIAYQFMDFNSENKLWRLGLMDSADGRLLNVIDFPLLITERSIAWRPGDNLLTMVFKNGENSGFLLLSPTNSSYQTIENVTTEKISSFVWSPDGKRLAFTSNLENSDLIMVKDTR